MASLLPPGEFQNCLFSNSERSVRFMSNLYAIGDIHGQSGMVAVLIEKVPFK